MPAYFRASVLGLPAVACILFLTFRRDRPAKVPEPLDVAAMRELARVGDGFLVWERNVAGRWQIWCKSLDGTKAEERLVPEEPERDHFCPKISPDGRKLAYLSYRRGETPYSPAIAVLWGMDLRNKKQWVLAEQARSYFEDRAVVWFGNDRLCHVDAKGGAVELDLDTMKRKPLTAVPHRRHGWLVNPQKTHATSGEPEFPLYDPQTREVQGQPKHGGCQPYFSGDGRWGFWMGGPGGPVNKMFLPTRMVSQVLDRDDLRMPTDREYLYFPMLSHCGRLMAFGASHRGHDHFASDYDIFVVRVDRETLDPIGHPVRCTNFAGNDRFPDVFCEELPLQAHFVEGTTRLSFESPTGKACAWRVNSRDMGTSTTLEHLFAQPGDHWVEAVLPEVSTPRGLVYVRETRPPQL
ncbi:MAG: TolB family protein [Roseimicrobium sp.]